MIILFLLSNFWDLNFSEKAAMCEERAEAELWEYIEKVPSREYKTMFVLCLQDKMATPACEGIKEHLRLTEDTLFVSCIYEEQI